LVFHGKKAANFICS